ncbi:MAG: InlB B-repeat-containing protein, partial [Limisphaerales bacterium]
LNGGSWTLAATTNSWTHWTARVSLNPGTNTISAYAIDTSVSVSPTKTVKCVYVLTAPVEVQIARVGMVTPGRVTPNYNGKWLDIGNNYSMTAKADKGFAFSDWSWSAGSTNNSTLRFLMAPNLSFTANFVDVTRPVNVISYPAVNAKITNDVISARGKATDNVGVTMVWYQFNSNGWNQALSTNNWTNWVTAPLTLLPQTNVIQAVAEDAAQNLSLTNTVKFLHP